MRPKLQLLVFFLALFAACKKNDVKPEIETIELGITLGNDTTVSLSAIQEPFSIITSDENVATAEKQGDEIKITSHKVGYTEIKIIDQNSKEQVLVKVWVSRGFSLLEVKSYDFVIEVSDQNIKTEIETKLNTSNPLAIGALYGISYLSGSSTLHVFPGGIDGEEILGEVSFDNNTKTIHLSYDDKSYQYQLMIEYSRSKMNGKNKIMESPVVPAYFSFHENLTEQLKVEYPNTEIRNVTRIHRLESFKE